MMVDSYLVLGRNPDPFLGRKTCPKRCCVVELQKRFTWLIRMLLLLIH